MLAMLTQAQQNKRFSIFLCLWCACERLLCGLLGGSWTQLNVFPRCLRATQSDGNRKRRSIARGLDRLPPVFSDGGLGVPVAPNLSVTPPASALTGSRGLQHQRRSGTFTAAAQTLILAVQQRGEVNYFHLRCNWLRLSYSNGFHVRLGSHSCFPPLVFGEPCTAPKLDAADWFYCGLSSPFGIVAEPKARSAMMRRCCKRILSLSFCSALSSSFFCLRCHSSCFMRCCIKCTSKTRQIYRLLSRGIFSSHNKSVENKLFSFTSINYL